MTLNGIDISSHQTGINLAAVPADFVLVKTTQGTWYVNPDADRAYQQAKKAGKLLVPADFVIFKTTQGNLYVNPDADRA